MNQDYRKTLFNNQLSSFPKPKKGSGLVNSLIDNLPLELHVPVLEHLKFRYSLFNLFKSFKSFPRVYFSIT